MNDIKLSVREIEKQDVQSIVDYWTKSDHEFLKSMGVEISKIPSEKDLTEMLSEQLNQDYNEKKSYAIIWLINNLPAGHCNINKIIFGTEAYMHLHLWQTDLRQKGCGLELLKMTLPYFFKNMNLHTLYCEPYALNNAPNKTLPKAGFEFVKEYVTTPGYLNFEQPVKLWQLKREQVQF